MGKGKRNRDARKDQPITIGRGEFKAYICNIAEHCDDASFIGLSQLLLMACGILDRDGNMTEEGERYWDVEDGRLVPNELALELYGMGANRG